jgi:hypothetical protein
MRSFLPGSCRKKGYGSNACAVCLASGGKSVSETVLWRGVVLVTTFYSCWGIMITVGFLTSVGVQVGQPDG